MCRFLLVRSKKKLKPEKLLRQFALMCQKSHAPDGDWQGDGWGIAWFEKGNWQLYKSLLPVWEDQNKFSDIPSTNLFAVHARSAGFPQHKNNLDYNQPYLGDNLCFVFNGMIRGVNLNRELEGQIGSQKIFSLLQQEIIHKNGQESLKTLDTTMLNNSRSVEGMNVGLILGNNFYVLCRYSKHPEYFTLHYFQSRDLALVCSEKIGDHAWKPMFKGEIRVL
ncbi:hypothetical protein A3D78_04645 [Candidatus Gottesmanbacteria bacterium RIFCSPHIGHO2_02_FULL_39_14]|uniref:Glutamine amidotransferase type-2 domain-containing protein n=1 Tax=Candidatus Gottesmanbacteria bacterium RIFCSPHIGHO2_02_FULL_39_14 TaxID=1798383 RepID=A0A1F5ZY18_9BACT|nr:MAG: hypothetical protein A3D78_04645 [Candidatus Gottesmanbacteria bacterium RIFCSPHIGHO2_02_FULL_39_14]